MGRAAIILCILLAGTRATRAQTVDLVSRADLLRNQGEYRGAAQLLRTHLATAPKDDRAELMLAETLYWQGDLTAARLHFRNVLRRSPQNGAARRQLGEIEAATASWIQLQGHVTQDNQPLDRNGIDLQAGFFMSPLWSLALRANPERAAVADLNLDRVLLEAAVGGYFPWSRVELDIRAGWSRWTSTDVAVSGSQSDRNGTDATARVRLGLRVKPGWVVGGSLERALYTSTSASLAAPVMNTTIRATARVDRNGWLGEAAGQMQRYPDHNSIASTYAWLLAPLMRSSSLLLQGGYAISYDDAQHSRFRPIIPQRITPGGKLEGHYDPYFTPERELQHSLAGSLALWSSNGSRLQLNGSFGAYARRQVPSLSQQSGPGQNPQRDSVPVFTPQTFYPYNVHAAGTLPLARNLTITIDGEQLRTAFYRQTRLSATVAVRLVQRPRT